MAPAPWPPPHSMSQDQSSMYHTWMRYFTPSPVHHRLGLVCLGVGLQHGALPTVGPRTLDHHVAVIISAGSGWFRPAAATRVAVTAPSLIWLTPGTPAPLRADPAPAGTRASSTSPARPPPPTPNSATSSPTGPSSRSATPPARAPSSARIARAARRGNPLLEVESRRRRP